ncbi:DUF3895 domain-containing protein [Metabacillus idriensis]|uniref:DUF3895 domain-containing protein n=1 Tax=Metabacillus idriensis TaxID=324768 RepID=UPI00174BE073|nr:DUF3895 domain-containing protein [Metabacillus idriensis]
MNYYFETHERTEILDSLTEDQRSYLLEQMKRGKRTLFSNEIARSKGTYRGSDQELDREIQEWEFIELLDGGLGNRPYRCECGMPLRYQYIVKNTETGEIKKFGKDHFEFHTGIPATIVKDIIKGFAQIDFELDEILYKVVNGWDSMILTLAKEFEIDLPQEIQDHIFLKLPLLDRQISRLSRMVYKEKQELHKKRQLQQLEEMRRSMQTTGMVKTNAPAVNTIPRADPKKISVIPNLRSPLGDKVHQFIIQLIETAGTISVLEVCEEMNEISHDFKGYYDSGKPKAFGYVAMVLDQLVDQGACRLDSKTFEDRWYSVR